MLLLALIRNVSLFAQKAVLFHLKSNTHLAFIEIVMSETAMTAIIVEKNMIQAKIKFIYPVRLKDSVYSKSGGKIHSTLVIHYENLFPQFSPHA